MSANPKDEFDKIKIKLEKLQTHLEVLLQNAELDLEIAAQLQKLLHQNRLNEVHGIECVARYISAHGISSEGFDLITTQKGREVWMVFSWAETFGLSSILLQSMIHLQSKALIEAKSNLQPADVFNDLSHCLAQAKKAGHYRLLVAKFDTAHLKISGCAVGFAPFMMRTKEKNQFQNLALCQPEALSQKPQLLNAGMSSTPTPSQDAYHFHFPVPTGSRLYFLSSTFSEAKSLEEFKIASALFTEKSMKLQSDLVDDLNLMLMNAEDFLKSHGKTADITAVALQVDASKLHLA